MGLIDKLLAGVTKLPASAASAPADRVLVRVYLDTAGRVTDVKIKKSCGDPERDAQAQREIMNMRFASKGKAAKTSHNWHDLAYTFHD
ncbi:energy transducer TonB [Collimonas sp.]|jgi:TonB family protein|uniref:energy transducer TonB family protein n=1 Tax=Collimonas sp. TaxID=1963772 RepID=UPI002BC7E92D|nr:energy transducer TonB [Collimonas sp.]HWW06777.1 energy transducer TonB [Collimonas sp.]